MGFKIVFHVEDEDGKIIIEKQETSLDVATSDLSGPDRVESSRRYLERWQKAGEQPADRSEEEAANRTHEFCLAAGSIIGRFVEKRLREWAKAKIDG